MSQIWVAIQTFPDCFSMRDSWSIKPSPAWLATGFTSQCLQNLCHFLKIKKLKVIVEEGAFFCPLHNVSFVRLMPFWALHSPGQWGLSRSLWRPSLFSFLPFFLRGRMKHSYSPNTTTALIKQIFLYCSHCIFFYLQFVGFLIIILKFSWTTANLFFSPFQSKVQVSVKCNWLKEDW